MKKIIALFVFAVSAATVFAQTQTTQQPSNNDTIVSEIAPPPQMEAAFNKMFKGATNAHWNMDNMDAPIVSFVFGGKNMQALFAADGSLIWKETDLAVTEFPKAANDYLATVLNPHEIIRYYKFESVKNSDYEVDMKWNGHVYWFQFDLDGKLTSRKLKM